MMFVKYSVYDVICDGVHGDGKKTMEIVVRSKCRNNQQSRNRNWNNESYLKS